MLEVEKATVEQLNALLDGKAKNTINARCAGCGKEFKPGDAIANACSDYAANAQVATSPRGANLYTKLEMLAFASEFLMYYNPSDPDGKNNALVAWEEARHLEITQSANNPDKDEPYACGCGQTHRPSERCG